MSYNSKNDSSLSSDEFLPTFQRTHSSEELVISVNKRQAHRIRKRLGPRGIERISSFVPQRTQNDRFGSILKFSEYNITPRIPLRRASQELGSEVDAELWQKRK